MGRVYHGVVASTGGEAGMRGIAGERVLLRMILSESRTHDHQPLYQTDEQDTLHGVRPSL